MKFIKKLDAELSMSEKYYLPTRDGVEYYRAMIDGRYSKDDIAIKVSALIHEKYRVKIPKYILVLIITKIFDVIRDEVLSGKSFEIRKFGVFSPKYFPIKEYRNPKTLEKVPIPKRVKVYFKPGKYSRKDL